MVEAESGAISEAQLFIAVMGGSSFTFADVFPSQEMPRWFSGHVNAVEWFGACPVQPGSQEGSVTGSHRASATTVQDGAELGLLFDDDQ